MHSLAVEVRGGAKAEEGNYLIRTNSDKESTN
jgi:hypothetical protein